MNARLMLHFVLVAHSFAWQPAMAQHTLTIPTEIAHISNPGLSTVDSGSVTLIRFDPQYTIRLEEESAVTEFAFGGLIERSSDTSRSANRELPRASVLWQNTSAVSVFELRASLEEASTRETEFAEFGRVTLDSTSTTGLLGTRWAHDLTPSSSMELAATHRLVRYDTPLLLDYSETQASALYAFQPGANARYTLAANASHLNLNGLARTAALAGLRAGYERDLSENVTLRATLGAVRVNLPRRQTHAVGELRLSYEGERIGYAFRWSHDVSASGSLGGYERSSALDAALTYPLTANTTLSVGAGRVRSLEAGGDIGASAFVRTRTELTRFWALTLALESRRATPSGRPSARSNAAIVGLVYENPNF